MATSVLRCSIKVAMMMSPLLMNTVGQSVLREFNSMRGSCDSGLFVSRYFLIMFSLNHFEKIDFYTDFSKL